MPKVCIGLRSRSQQGHPSIEENYSMEQLKQSRPKPMRTSDIQQRGRALQHRFRVAGFPQYTRWYVDQEPKWKGDASLMNRINVLFNGRGSMEDVELLLKCEALADKGLPKNADQAAA